MVFTRLIVLWLTPKILVLDSKNKNHLIMYCSRLIVSLAYAEDTFTRQ